MQGQSNEAENSAVGSALGCREVAQVFGLEAIAIGRHETPKVLDVGDFAGDRTKIDQCLGLGAG